MAELGENIRPRNLLDSQIDHATTNIKAIPSGRCLSSFEGSAP